MTWGFAPTVETMEYLKMRKSKMTVYNLLQELKLIIVLNPFEWTIFIGALCLLTGTYFEYLVGWWKPIKEENEMEITR